MDGQPVDGHMDGQLGNIMPLPPLVGGGIKLF